MESEQLNSKSVLQQKNKLSAKDFIKMKRKQVKSERSSTQFFDKLRSMIQNKQLNAFQSQIVDQTAALIKVFLFSSNQVKQTPLSMMIQSDEYEQYLSILNKWSSKHAQTISNEILNTEDQYIKNDWQSKYYYINKLIITKCKNLSQKNIKLQSLLLLISQQSSLYFILSLKYLKLDLIITLINNNKSNFDILSTLFVQLFKISALKDKLSNQYNNIKIYQIIMKRQRIWSNLTGVVRQNVEIQTLELLRLKEINYNFMHQLANVNRKEVIQILKMINNHQIQNQKAVEQLSQMFEQITSYGIMLSDICLNTWGYQQIKQFLTIACDIQNIYLTTKCLNMILCNSNLKQKQKESLIVECLHGKMAEKGYAKIMSIFKKKHLKNNRFIEMKTSRYTFSLCYDINEVKKQRDASNSYPLVLYIKLYKQTSSISLIQKLMLPQFNRKQIKKQYNILLNSNSKQSLKVSKHTQKYHHIIFLYEYYQPLWKEITKLQHGEILTYLLSKLFINCYQIKVVEEQTTKQVQIQAHAVCDHFIKYYILNNSNLLQNEINKLIIKNIFESKQNEQNIGSYKLHDQLIRSLCRCEIFYKSQTFLISAFRQIIKKYIQPLTNVQLLESKQIWNGKCLLNYIAQPILRHMKVNPLLPSSDIINKIGRENIKQLMELQREKPKSKARSIFQQLAKEFNIYNKKDEKRQFFKIEVKQSMINIQFKYHQYFRGSDKNELFFKEFGAYLYKKSQVMEGLMIESFKLKYCYFRLSPRQNHLQYKFQSLLYHGIDPYFSKYSPKDGIKFDQNDKWSSIYMRMLQHNFSFLTALITDPHAKFADFKYIFDNCYHGDRQKKMAYNLFDHIKLKDKQIFFNSRDFTHRDRSSVKYPSYYFIKNIKIQTNILFIEQLFAHAQKIVQDSNRYNSRQIINAYISLNLKLKSYCIQKLQMKLEQNKQDVKVLQQIKMKKAQFVKYIEDWIPFLMNYKSQKVQEWTSSQKKQQVMGFYQFFKNRKVQYVLDAFLKLIPLKEMYQEIPQILLRKAELIPNFEQDYLNILQKLPGQQLQGQILFFISSRQYVTLLKKFSYSGLIKLYNIAKKCYQQFSQYISLASLQFRSQDKERAVRRRQFVINFIKGMNSLMPIQHKIQFYILIKKQLIIKPEFSKCKSALRLKSIQNWKIIFAQLILEENINTHTVFYAKQDKIKKYDNKNIYNRCNQSNFDIYVASLQKYHKENYHLDDHLNVVINCLIAAQRWERVMKIVQIKAIADRIIILIFKRFYQSLNRKKNLQNPTFKTLAQNLFKKYQIMLKTEQFDNDLFKSMCLIDWKKAFELMKPKMIKMRTLKTIIIQNPEMSHMILQNKIIIAQKAKVEFSQQQHTKQLQFIKNNFIEKHYFMKLKNHYAIVPNYTKHLEEKWIVDYFRAKLFIARQEDQQHIFGKTIRSIMDRPEVLPFKSQIFALLGQNYYEQNICACIVYCCPQLTSLEILQKHTSDLKTNLRDLLKQYLFSSTNKKKGKCVNLQRINKTLLTEFINLKYLTSIEQGQLYSSFVRLLDRCDLQLLESFISVNKIKVNYQFLLKFNQYFKSTFWQYLFGINNQKFLIELVNKYKLFQMFNLQDYSGLLLMTICRYRYNKLLEYTIKYFQVLNNKKIIFVAQSLQNQPKITQNGVFFMPIQISIANSFYQTYFLIKQSQNQCQKFNISGRFLTKADPEEWNYFPSFKRRVSLNNLIMEQINATLNRNINQGNQINFRYKTFISGIFQLSLSNIQINNDENHISHNYTSSLCKFISDINKSKGQINYSKDQIGIFQTLQIMINNKDQTKIPEYQLQKMHPNGMKLINKLKSFIPHHQKMTIQNIFYFAPQFKHLLFLYNPETYLRNSAFAAQLIGQEQEIISQQQDYRLNNRNKVDFILYLKGFLTNVIYLQKNHQNILIKYVRKHFIQGLQTIGKHNSSLYMSREALILLLINIWSHNRKWQQSSIFALIFREMFANSQENQEVLYDISRSLNFRGDNLLIFDMSIWNRMITQISQIQNHWEKLNHHQMQQFKLNKQQISSMIKNYITLFNNKLSKCYISNIKQVLQDLYDNFIKKTSRKGIYLELSFLMNLCLIQNQIKLLYEQVSGLYNNKQQIKLTINLTKTIRKDIQFKTKSQLLINVTYDIKDHTNKNILMVYVDIESALKDVSLQMYHVNLQINPQIKHLNQFCNENQRHICFKGFKFRYNVASFKNIREHNLLEIILKQRPMKHEGILGKIMDQIEKLEQKLDGSRALKLYDSGDIYGPLNFNEQTNKDVIMDYLCFYELISLPKAKQIQLMYRDNIKEDKQMKVIEKNQRSINHIRNYFQYYVNASKEQNIQEFEIDNKLWLYRKQSQNGLDFKICIDWSYFGAWNIYQFTSLAFNFSISMINKLKQVLEVRISYQSLINYYEKYLQTGGQSAIRPVLQNLLMNSQLNNVTESVLIMVSEDIQNIMKIIKGILIKFEINKKSNKKTTPITISQNTSLISIQYIIKQSILHIILNLKIQKNLNPVNTKAKQQDIQLLINRKQFFDSIFTSSQFLTDYFLLRHQLNTKCTQISRNYTKQLNTMINFHIEYQYLYNYVEILRQNSTIKTIQQFLNRLKNYLSKYIEVSIQSYLNSNQLANKHQIYLLNKCEAINKSNQTQQIQHLTEIRYQSKQLDNSNGITQLNGVMKELIQSKDLKNTFLIQIYKSYYTTMVTQGMMFVVGYKSGKQKVKLIKISVSDDINLINIIDLDYILIVSKTFPTNDELNQNKIIRIFITDCNKNIYRFNNLLKDYFFNLPLQSQERNISNFAPLISPNIKLKFYNGQSQIQQDSKTTKIFYIMLNEEKIKMKPLQDQEQSPINNLKRSIQFKETITTLQKQLNKFISTDITIVIDPPSSQKENISNANISNIINLVSYDIIQFLNKFQYQPMRNGDLDCKLSVERQFNLIKNSIIQLRKLVFSKYFKALRIKLRQKLQTMTFANQQISINISLSNSKVLPSSSQYLLGVLQYLIKKQQLTLPKNVQILPEINNQSIQLLLKYFDIINTIPYQLQQLQNSLQLLKLLFNKQYIFFKIIITRKKSQIKFDKDTLIVVLNVSSEERQFYSTDNIINHYLKYINTQFQSDYKNISFYNYHQQQIAIVNNYSDKIKVVFQDQTRKFVMKDKVDVKVVNNLAMIQLKQKIIQNTRYYVYVQESGLLYSNYFYNINNNNSIYQHNTKAYRGQQKHLYIQSNKHVNFNYQTVLITQSDTIDEMKTLSYDILNQLSSKLKINIKLISKNIYVLMIRSQQSVIVNINHKGNKNFFNINLQNIKLTICSNGELSLNNTKFIQLQPYKKKAVPIKQEKEDQNYEFKETVQLVQEEQLSIKEDFNNIENLVYVVNDYCKKYLTRAGDPRCDYIQLCDSENNPIQYQKPVEIYFIHINRLAIIKPQIIKRNLQYGLKWCPTIKGHYYMYINNIRMNPPYEIGVCAAQADFSKSIVKEPKIKKVCYCQQTELMFDLRDSFGNLYCQLQEDILGDSLLIDFQCSQYGQSLKVQKSQINKYGLKKVKFSFNSQAHGASNVKIQVLLNRQYVCIFDLQIQGFSLKQRKKLLEKDINQSNKNYYKQIVLNRNKFLQDLVGIAEKSMHATFSVKFYNEPGIDAGGVKRQFYDMIGNEMKNERNPFFKIANPKTMQYFLNPQILRNKKKHQYMQLWGKCLANSILNGYLIGITFSPVFMKLVYDQTINFQDLLQILPQEEKKQYQYLLKAQPEEFQDLGLYFTVMVDKKKCIQYELKENGKNIQVNIDNVKEYLQTSAVVLVKDRYKQIIDAFKKGFQSVLQLNIIKKWIRSHEFWCLTSGNKEITPQLVLNYINFSGNHIEQISGWFRRYISEANLQTLIGFLKFTSGSSSIEFSLASKITVSFQNAGINPKKLPISHTCWKQIVIPKYKTYEIMKKLLTAAFIYCSEGFGFG